MKPESRRPPHAAGASVERLKRIPRSRLFWRLAGAFLLVLFAVNTVVLLPGLRAPEERMLERLHDEAKTIVGALDRIASAGLAPEDFATLAEQVMPGTDVKGGAIYDADGDLVHAFGEMPQLVPEVAAGKPREMLRRTYGQRHDIVWRRVDQNNVYYIAIRADRSFIGATRGQVLLDVLAASAVTALLATVAVLALMVGALLDPLFRIHRAISLKDAGLIDPALMDHPGEIGDIARSVRTFIAEGDAGRRQSADALSVADDAVEANRDPGESTGLAPG